jgi:hypothetical protein
MKSPIGAIGLAAIAVANLGCFWKKAFAREKSCKLSEYRGK